MWGKIQIIIIFTFEFYPQTNLLMYKYTQLFSALIILVSIVEISCLSSNTTPQTQKTEISYNTTNKLPQASLASLNPTDQYQKLIRYNNQATKFMAKAKIDTDLNKPKNTAIMILSQFLGYMYSILMITGGIFLFVEPIKVKCTSGLSKNFLLIH